VRRAVIELPEDRHVVAGAAGHVRQQDKHQGHGAGGANKYPQPARRAGIRGRGSHRRFLSILDFENGHLVRYETKRPEFVNEQSGADGRYRTLSPI
jgi:hypothetical protein